MGPSNLCPQTAVAVLSIYTVSTCTAGLQAPGCETSHFSFPWERSLAQAHSSQHPSNALGRCSDTL
eukprot:539518-Amphidinium_carterae.1